jgi:hypothetical protein
VIVPATVHRAVKRNNRIRFAAIANPSDKEHGFHFTLFDPNADHFIAIDETCFYHNDSPGDGDQQAEAETVIVFSCGDLNFTAIDRAGIVKHESQQKPISFAAFLDFCPTAHHGQRSFSPIECCEEYGE